MAGADGDDRYFVDAAGDVVIEAVGKGVDIVRSTVTYTLSDNVENLSLLGSDAINAFGNALANEIDGNTGNNVIGGGDGNDRLRGFAGQDAFVFSSVSSTDSIVDFSAVDDTIRLDQAFFGAPGIGGLSASAFKDIGVGVPSSMRTTASSTTARTAPSTSTPMAPAAPTRSASRR